MRSAILVVDGAVNGTSHDPKQFPVASVDWVRLAACGYRAILQSRDQLVVQEVLRSAAAHQHRHFLCCWTETSTRW